MPTKDPECGELADDSCCRICLQSRKEIDTGLARFVVDILAGGGGRINALVRLHCDCSVGSMRHICYQCLQEYAYESSRGGKCDLCQQPLFPLGAEPRHLLQAIFWLKCFAGALFAMLLLVMASTTLYSPSDASFGATLAGGFALALALITALALIGLLAVQFRRGGICPQVCGGGGSDESGGCWCCDVPSQLTEPVE